MTVARWYVVNVYAGFEKKTVSYIDEFAKKRGLTQFIEQMLVPSESVVEIRKGAKVNVEKQCFPGYILVKMVLNDDTWRLIKSMPKVGGFLGASGKPAPISEAEVSRIVKQVKESVIKPRSSFSYDVGESVRVVDGPFTSFSGVVEGVDQEKSRLKVSVMIFGRPTPVELEYAQVEKA